MRFLFHTTIFKLGRNDIFIFVSVRLILRSRHDGISVFCTEYNLIEYLGIRAHEFVFVEPRCGSGFICPTHAPDYIRSYLN